MSDEQRLRRAELLGLALAGELSDDERRELDALRERDSSIDAELRDLTALGRAVRVSGYDDRAPSAGLRERVAGIAAGEAAAGSIERTAAAAGEVRPQPGPAAVPGPAAPRRASRAPRSSRRPWLGVLAAAACIGIGAGGVLGIQTIGAQPEQGPPGTLGVTETITFEGEPAGVDIDASLVAHTWGTETVLRIDGLDASDTYSVVLVGADSATPSGSFHGSTVVITCRLNAAVMRASVTEVDIVDATGTTIATASVPPVA